MSSTTITDDVISKVAKLARLKLTPEEVHTFAVQLGPILDHINKLNNLDTDSTLPTFQVTSLKDVFRDDVVQKSLLQKDALSSALKSSQGYVVMPKTIDK